MADEGNIRAAKVIALQEQPGNFFTVVQIGLNAVAILGGIIGDTAFSRISKACWYIGCHRIWREKSASCCLSL